MHHFVRQSTVVGQHEQTGGLHVEAPHADPAAVLEPRQPLEHRLAALFVMATADGARGLVEQDDFSGCADAQRHPMAIDLDAIAGRRTLPDMGNFSVDRHPSMSDPALDLAARTETCAGEDLM